MSTEAWEELHSHPRGEIVAQCPVCLLDDDDLIRKGD
ncbi:hypothetical protein SEA_LIFES_104 [Microbacterium phage Lifes]|nr:hypothetical protein SEA_LIFES_104 [Microbacterium phage Lifes]